MKKDYIFRHINLQLFAEGSGTDGDGTSGVTEGASLPSSDGVTSTEGADTANQQEVVEDLNADFEALIKGKYKEQYNSRVQDTVQKRLKGTKETVDRYNSLAPTLEMLSKKYGVDANDIEALNHAIEEDDSYYEDEAMEKGITVEQLKSVRKLERENAQLKRQMDEVRMRENADRITAEWEKQGESLKAIYPQFDMRSEVANPKFAQLLQCGIDVKTAYEVVHKDELNMEAIQYATQHAKQQVTNDIIANGMRPTENGLASQSATVVKSSVSQLTREQREDLARRARNGERITF